MRTLYAGSVPTNLRPLSRDTSLFSLNTISLIVDIKVTTIDLMVLLNEPNKLDSFIDQHTEKKLYVSKL